MKKSYLTIICIFFFITSVSPLYANTINVHNSWSSDISYREGFSKVTEETIPPGSFRSYHMWESFKTSLKLTLIKSLASAMCGFLPSDKGVDVEGAYKLDIRYKNNEGVWQHVPNCPKGDFTQDLNLVIVPSLTNPEVPMCQQPW